MSVVTGIVIQIGSCDRQFWPVISQWFLDRGYGPVKLRAGYLDSNGNKHPQIAYGVVGCNYFSEHAAGLPMLIKAIDWIDPNQVVVLMTTEDRPTHIIRASELKAKSRRSR